MAFPIYVSSKETKERIPEILQAQNIQVKSVDFPKEFADMRAFSFMCSRGLGRIDLFGHFDADTENYELFMTVTHAVFWCSDMKLIKRVNQILLRNGVSYKNLK